MSDRTNETTATLLSLDRQLRATKDVETRCELLREALASVSAPSTSDQYADLFRRALPQALHETIVFGLDRDGTYLFVFTDPALSEKYGVKDGDFVGRSLRDVFPPQLAEERIELGRELLRTGGRHREEHPVRLPNGEFWHDTCLSALPTGDGPPEIVLAFVHDITERKHIERRLRESEERYRSVVEQATESIVIHQGERIVYANPATFRVFGMEEGSLEGHSPLDFIIPAMQPIAASRMREVLLSSEPLPPVTYTFVRPDGTTLQGEVVGSRIVYGDAPAALITIRDVTDRDKRRRLDEQIRRAQKLESLAGLAGGVAHDFNNLLVGVLGNASLAARAIPEGTPGRDRIIAIEKAANRAAELTQQLLSYAGEGHVSARTIELNALVDEMVGLVRVSMSKSVEVHRQLDPALPSVLGDPTQLRQVTMNLLLNASEAIGDRAGRIAVSTSTFLPNEAWLADAYVPQPLAPQPHAMLRVADDGGGMDASTLTRLFDPFYSTKASGRGLGLASVLGVVRGHGGALKVSSKPGDGATFELLLPLASERHEALGVRSETTPSLWHGSGSVLVVDDEPPVREVARAALEHLGFEVFDASNGADALRIYGERANDFVAVLLDVTMPGMRGDEVLERLREIRPNVRVVVMSGYCKQQVGRRMTEGENSLFLKKPFTLEDLAESLRKVLEG